MNSVLRFPPLLNSVKKFTTSAVCSTKRLSSEQTKGKGVPMFNRWNRALAEAEKLLGYPKILLNEQSLQNEDALLAVKELWKVSGSSHPLRRNIKRLFYDKQNNLQARGTILLLLSKVINKSNTVRTAATDDIEKRQNALATILELIYSAQEVHMGVMNTDKVDCDEETRKELEYGNKLSILFADYLMARGHTLYVIIKSTEVVHMLSGAARDFCKSQCHYDQDNQGNPYPTSTTSLEDWNTYTFQTRGSLMANACKSMLLLQNADDELKELGYEFGRNLGFAWQTSTELASFVDKGRNPDSKFSLVSCPVLLQLQRDASLLDLITPHQQDLNAANYEKIHEILEGSQAVEESREIFNGHVQGMMGFLKQFPDSAELNALKKIIYALEL